MNDTGKKSRHTPRNILLLGLVSMFIDMSTEMVYPIMPMFLVALGAAPAIIGVIEGITDGLAAILRVFAGYISDKTQKKKGMAIIGYSAAFIYKIGLLISRSWVGVFISKLVDRTGKGLRTAPRDSLIADSAADGYGKNFGLHKMFDMLGAALGVLLAYFIISNSFEYNTVFYYSLIPAAAGVFILCFVREKKRPPAVIIEVAEPKAEPAAAAAKKRLSLRDVKLSKNVWLYLITIFVFSIGNASKAFLLLKAQDSGVSIANSLLFYLLLNVAASLLSIPFGRLSDKIGRRPLIICGYALYAAVYLGFGLSSSPWAIAMLFGLYGIHTAMVSGSEKALMVEIAPKQLKGTVLGLQGMAQGIGVLISSTLMGVIWQFAGSSTAFYLGAALAAVAAVAMIFILRMPDKNDAEPAVKLS